MKKRKAQPRRPGVHRSSAQQIRRRRERPAAEAGPPGDDAVRAVVAKLSGPLLEWWDEFWPFGKEVDPLAVLSGRIPAAVARAYPLESPRDSFTLLDAVVREERAIVEGRNEKFERAVTAVTTALARLDIPREKLIRLTACPFLPALEWAIDRSKKIEAIRPTVKTLAHRLRSTRRYLAIFQREILVITGAPFSAARLISSLTAEIDAHLDYLARIPTKGALKTWRRKLGVNRRDVAQLGEWTHIARGLVKYLREESGERSGTCAERQAHQLLYARYPHAVDPDWRKLYSRVNK